MTLFSHKIDKRPRLGAWAPGNYSRQCLKCKEWFIGDKRAKWCADCAYAVPIEAPENHKPYEWPQRAPTEPTGRELFAGLNEAADMLATERDTWKATAEELREVIDWLQNQDVTIKTSDGKRMFVRCPNLLELYRVEKMLHPAP